MMKISDIVEFRGDLLFNGAVQIKWFESDPERRRRAVEHFVFHGPEYHGVSQDDLATSSEHTLIDTASFTKEILEAIGDRDRQSNPFALAIAGYGTGKSHLALTLSSLLADPKGESATIIQANLQSVDDTIGSQVRNIINESDKPYLVIAINGMDNFDLARELSRQILERVKAIGADPFPIEQLRPRFQTAMNILNALSSSILNELTAALDGLSKQEIAEQLEAQDEVVFQDVAQFSEQRLNIPIVAIGRESIQELLDVACSSYCGDDKPFRSLVIIFDEFGRYTEFATQKSQVAGSGVLQQMFEGIQQNTEKALFLGLIQFELNAYLERIAPEFKNDIIRVITRYQTSRNYYLSVNLETLIAHTIQRRNPDYLARIFERDGYGIGAAKWIEKLTSWFPQIRRHALWQDPERFLKVIQKGCWPLHPVATWLLYHLTSSGKYLQQRSALTILDKTFRRIADLEIPEDPAWTLPATSLWSDELFEDLLSAEGFGKQGAVAHAYATVCDRYGNQFNETMIQSLRAVVLAAKMRLTVSSRTEALEALSILSGISAVQLTSAVENLQNEYNVVEWDDNFKQFEIIGDAVPRTQFLGFLRNRVAEYDSQKRADLFYSKGKEWCDLLRNVVDPDYAVDHDITTKEWAFAILCSNTQLLETHIAFAVNSWLEAFEVDTPRGHIIYCYVGQESDIAVVKAQVEVHLRSSLQDVGVSAIPLLVVLLHDEAGKLGQALAEYTVLNENMTPDEKERYGNFILSHTEKAHETIRTEVNHIIQQRCYVSYWDEQQLSGRLSKVTYNIFQNLYPKPIPFPFDGFRTARGNAADDCHLFIRELLMGRLDHAWYTSQQPRVKNRADSVLDKSWNAISKDGSISLRPGNSVIGDIIREIDAQFHEEKLVNLGSLIRKYCRPPFGGNIASVGMLLGIFAAPRQNNLAVTLSGENMSFDLWLQRRVFKGKFLNLDVLDKTNLFLLSEEESQEWENLLAEWEQASSHKAQVDYLRQGEKLKDRLTIPPRLAWQYKHSEEQAKNSMKALEVFDEKENQALERLEKGYQREDAGHIGRAGAELTKLQQRMEADASLWTTNQIQELTTHINHARQAVIQYFDPWIARQTPRSGKPDDVGKFRHWMLKLVHSNLVDLQLPQLADKLQGHVSAKLRTLDQIMDAKTLSREIQGWVNGHIHFSPLTKMVDLDEYLKAVSDFSDHLKGQQIELPELIEAKAHLNDFKDKCHKLRQAHMQRAKDVWNISIETPDDTGKAVTEINALLEIFDGKDADLEDFQMMHKVLVQFSKDYEDLRDLSLSWTEFEYRCNRLIEKRSAEWEDDDPPWIIEEVYNQFRENIRSERLETAKQWWESIKQSATDIPALSVKDANGILKQIEKTPAYVTVEQEKQLRMLQKEIEQHLNNLEIEWLFERFKYLSPIAQQKFLKLAVDVFSA